MGPGRGEGGLLISSCRRKWLMYRNKSYSFYLPLSRKKRTIPLFPFSLTHLKKKRQCISLHLNSTLKTLFLAKWKKNLKAPTSGYETKRIPLNLLLKPGFAFPSLSLSLSPLGRYHKKPIKKTNKKPKCKQPKKCRKYVGEYAIQHKNPHAICIPTHIPAGTHAWSDVNEYATNLV